MINVKKKGNSFELYTVKQFREFYPDAMRQLEFQQDQCYGVDLRNTGHFLIQCKAYKNYAPINKIEEVKIQKEGQIPLLVTKGNNKKPVVCIYLEDFKRILRNPSDY